MLVASAIWLRVFEFIGFCLRNKGKRVKDKASFQRPVEAVERPEVTGRGNHVEPRWVQIPELSSARRRV